MNTAVVDASALVEALLPGPDNDPVREVLSGLAEFAGPEHLGIEVLNVLRRHDRRAPSPALVTARRTLAELNIRLVGLSVLHERIWDLRHTLTAYDAAYVAAAEHLQVPLITSDKALVQHPSLRCTVTDPRR